MALYAIGDLHLSLTADKSMEVFGPAWENYTERIGGSLSQLTADDVLVLAGASPPRPPFGGPYIPRRLITAPTAFTGCEFFQLRVTNPPPSGHI